MSMMDLKPNSNKYKQEQKQAETAKVEPKKVQKIVNGPVKVKKPSEAKKFANIFINEDIANVKNYVFVEVLVPAVKKAISDIVTNGIDMILYGESGRRRSDGSRGSKISYGNYFANPNRDRVRDDRRDSQVSNIFNYDNVIFGNRGDAELVLEQLEEVIQVYGIAKVADLYDFAGISTHGNFTGNNYGWTDLHTAKVQAVRDGYIIKLPRALPID